MSASILQSGRQACLAVERVATAQGTVPDAPVYLRDIAHDLERTLLRDPESAVHWVAVVNEPDTFGPPTSLWEHDDCLLQVSLAQGHSEGMLVYVFAQANRYQPDQLVPLLRVKLLCGVERALREIGAIWAYFNDSAEFMKVKTRN